MEARHTSKTIDILEYVDLLQARDLFRQAPIAIVRSTLDGRVITANQAFIVLLGYHDFKEFSSITGRKVTGVYQDPSVYQKITDHMEKTGRPIRYDSRWRRKDGSFFRCKLHLRASRSQNGDIRYLECFAEDTTQETWHNAILDTFPGYVYICTVNHKLLYLNKKTAKQTDTLTEDLPCYKRVFGLDTPCSWCENTRVFQGETVTSEFLHPGNDRWHYAISSPIHERENFISQKQTVIIDIHERKLAEIALQEKENSLLEENRILRLNIKDLEKSLKHSEHLHTSAPHTPTTDPQLQWQHLQVAGGPDLRKAVQQFEHHYITEQLESNQWNRTLTAKKLGIQRKTLYLKMKQLAISHKNE